MKTFTELLVTHQHFIFQVHSGHGGEGFGLLGWIDEFLASISEINFSEQIKAPFVYMGGIMTLDNFFLFLPIVLLACFLITELLGILVKKESFRDTANWLLYLGTITLSITFFIALFAKTSGLQNVAYDGKFAKEHIIELSSLILAIVLSVLHWGSRTRGILNVLLSIVLVSMVALNRSI